MLAALPASRDRDRVARPRIDLFSTNSATAFSGLLCDSAMIVIAFQSSPMRSRPPAAGRACVPRRRTLTVF